MSVYENVLLPVDLNHDESWNKGLPAAIGIAREFGATLHVITAVPDLHLPMIANYFPEGFLANIVSDLEEKLAAFVGEHVPADVPSRFAVVAKGSVYALILDYADRNDVDLIVLEAYSPDLKDYLLGSNAEKIARHAHQSVLVVRE